MNNSRNVDNLCEGIKKLFSKKSHDTGLNNLHSDEVSGTLANKVKSVIEQALSNDIDEVINRFGELNMLNADSVVNDVTKTIINSPRMLCLQENINNIIETCTQELITEYPSHSLGNLNVFDNLQHFNENYNNNDIVIEEKLQSNNVTPILQCYQYMEIAHNITAQKPLFVRIQAFEVLFSSQLTDAISSVQWSVLQKSLQTVLSDDDFDVFHLCLKVHAKLITCTSPEGIKESFLNILESLCQHYYTQKLECNEISIQIPSHYRIIRLTNLMLDCIKEITNSLPRFGEKRLIEMIDNFMHLISIHSTNSSHPDTNMAGFNILDIVSCLDPKANWFKYLSYSAVSRKIIFLKMGQNFCLLRIIISEIIDWFNNPIFADDDVLCGNINRQSCKFARFIHCLTLVSKICTFETGRNLFPITLAKDEEPIKIQKIAVMALKFLNKQRLIEEKLEVIFSDLLIKLLIESVEDLMSFKDMSNYTTVSLLHVLLEPLSEKPGLPPQHTVSIITSLCNFSDGPQNYFFKYGLHNNKRRNLLVNTENNSFTEQNISTNLMLMNNSNTTAFDDNNRQSNFKELTINNIEKQILTMKSTVDSFTYYSFCPVKLITNVLITLLKTKTLRDMTLTAKLMDACSKLFQLHEGIMLLESNKLQLIQNAAVVYQDLIDIIKADGYKVLEERNFFLLFSSIENFIMVTGTTPLGFLLIEEESRMMSDCFQQKLQRPMMSWDDSTWRLFMSFASFCNDCTTAISNESEHIFKNILIDLWSVMDDSFETDSSIQLDEAVNCFMVSVSTLSLSLNAVKAIMGDPSSDGNESNDYVVHRQSEETVTELTFESYPETIASMITKYGLVNDIFNYKVHEISLMVLNLFISANIDTMLCLLHNFHIQEKLLQLQSDNRVSDKGSSSAMSVNRTSTTSVDSIIVDECSLMRHEILEKSYSLGPHNGAGVETRLYRTAPLLSSIQLKTKMRMRTHIELSKFLQETKNGLHDVNWLKQARKAYRVGGNDDIKCTLVIELVERVQRALSCGTQSDSGEGIKWVSFESAEHVQLLPEDYIGIQLTIRYGVQHRLLQMQSVALSSENLAQLLRVTRLSLFHSQSQPEQFIGFDWFAAMIYLLCSGNVEKCLNILSSLSTHPCIPIVWNQYALSVGHSTVVCGHVLETVIKCEVPQAFYALRESGISWWLVCSQWMKECFWRVFDWNQMCHWSVFFLLHQPDYIVYLFVSILHHIEQRVLTDSTDGVLWKLITCPPEKFVFSEHLTYMDKLWRRYHSTVMSYLDMEGP